MAGTIELKLNDKNYIKFVKELFGKKSYQGSIDFIKWAQQGGFIKTQAVLNNIGEVSSIIQMIDHSGTFDGKGTKSFFNFIADPREAGSGMLHLANIKRANAFFIPAVSGELSQTYISFGGKQVELMWLQKTLLPVPGATFFKLFFSRSINIYNEKKDTFITNEVSSGLIAHISELAAPLSKKYIQWRLNSKGQKRIFIGYDSSWKSLVIACVGKRKNIRVMRIICCYGDEKKINLILGEMLGFARRVGVFVVLVTTSEQVGYSIIKQHAFKVRLGAKTITNNTQNLPVNDFCMLVGDLGFEEQWGS